LRQLFYTAVIINSAQRCMKKRTRFQEFIFNHNTLLVLYIVIAVLVSIQLVSLGANQQFNSAHNTFYTSYNNYIIFKQSFFHLIEGKDMYIHYPAEYYDLYKYSPSFAVFMGLFAYLPDIAGLMLWNTLNAVVLLYAIRKLPFSNRNIAFILLFILIELITSLQNSQSNALLAGLMIAAWNSMNRGKPQWATLWLVLATFIKVYGAAGFCLFLLFPQKPRFILYALLWTVLLLVLPLCLTSPQLLVYQYESWANMMAADQAASYGLSVMGWVQKWFGAGHLKTEVTIAGIILFFLPFARYRMYQHPIFRLLILAFILLWVIIFNHKAESATFIIAVAGIAIWYFAEKATTLRTILFWSAFVLASLSTTELFIAIRDEVTDPLALKPFGCIVIWVAIFVRLMTLKQAHLAKTV
jgi:hypothetical protein